MAKVFIEESTLTATANAIRAKKGTTALIDPAKFANEIEGIVAGGGGGELEIPAEQLTLTGDQGYRFYRSAWNWYLDKYGKYLSTKNLTYSRNMFADNGTIEYVPFDLNYSQGSCYAEYTFSNASYLAEAPKMNISGTFTSSFTLHNLFYNCSRLKNVDNVLSAEALEAGLSNFKASGSSSNMPKWGSLFYGCRCLGTIPPWFYKLRVSEDSTIYPSNSYCIYGNTFYNCSSLREIVDLPVIRCNGTAAAASNMFSSNTFNNCYNLKSLTFELNDGAPFVVRWKSQTMDVSTNIGYGNIAGYNTDFKTDTKVTNDETYQALKNTSDWWTTDIKYSRFNHDSAVATINSLPDTSAYLAEAGGTNTIKFKGSSGSLTDGGAINTLTEEEIAVATAKGWTVTLA